MLTTERTMWVTPYLYEDTFMFEDGVSVYIQIRQFKQPRTKEDVIKLALYHSLVFDLPISRRLQLLLKATFVGYEPTDTVEDILNLYYNISAEMIKEEFNSFPYIGTIV